MKCDQLDVKQALAEWKYAHVDAGEGLATRGLDVLDGDGALAAVAFAVAARAVQLPEVLDGEAIDGHRAGAVVLDDLVLSSATQTYLV